MEEVNTHGISSHEGDRQLPVRHQCQKSKDQHKRYQIHQKTDQHSSDIIHSRYLIRVITSEDINRHFIGDHKIRDSVQKQSRNRHQNPFSLELTDNLGIITLPQIACHKKRKKYNNP